MVEDTFFQEYEEKIREAEERAAAAAEKKAEERAAAAAEKRLVERSKEIAQYLIRKNWDIREIVEATKLDMDTVQSLYAQG